MEIIIHKLKNKYISVDKLPVLLFIITMVNFLPIFVSNILTKGPTNGINTYLKISLMIIEYIILAIYYILHYKKIKINKNKLIWLIIVSVILFAVQVYNYIIHNFYLNDIFNIGVFFVNVLFFYIFLYDYKIKEKSVLIFHKIIVFFVYVKNLLRMFNLI